MRTKKGLSKLFEILRSQQGSLLGKNTGETIIIVNKAPAGSDKGNFEAKISASHHQRM